MVDVTDLTRPGRNILAGSDPFELFLKKFSGEVANAFEIATVMMPIVRVRTITQGKTAQFPATGRVANVYHIAGKDVLDNGNGELQILETGERTILVDRSNISPVFIDELEELINHWDIRGPVATEIALSLARNADEKLQQMVIIGAASALGAVVDQPGGTVLSGAVIPELANSDTDGSALAEGLRRAQVALNEKNVPQGDRFCVTSPNGASLLAQQVDFLERDFGNGENGSPKEGMIGKMFGFSIRMSNQLPTTDRSMDATLLPGHATGVLNDYRVDATNTTAICFHRSAVGTVKLRDITMEMESSVQHQGTLILAKNAQGHGVLREDACVQIKTA